MGGHLYGGAGIAIGGGALMWSDAPTFVPASLMAIGIGLMGYGVYRILADKDLIGGRRRVSLPEAAQIARDKCLHNETVSEFAEMPEMAASPQEWFAYALIGDAFGAPETDGFIPLFGSRLGATEIEEIFPAWRRGARLQADLSSLVDNGSGIVRYHSLSIKRRDLNKKINEMNKICHNTPMDREYKKSR